jgi:CDP-glycerol glycerophosphotransferase
MDIITKVKSFRHDMYIEIFRHLPIQNNKIILWADSFRHFGCNPKYIALYLLKHYPGKFDLVWVFEEGVTIPEDIPLEIRIVRYFSIEYLKELHTAKIVICNMRAGSLYYWNKRRGQVYIQTWHSSLRLKKIEKDVVDMLNREYVACAKEDSSMIDLLISGSQFSTEIYKRAFWYHGKILESGTPRCDILLNNTVHTRKKVFSYYNLPEESKLILYAPTFRSNKPSDFLGMNFIRLKETLGNNWIIGARLHPNVLASVIPEGAVSMSNYPDMQELIAVADILITDFSSCMFDMAIAKKPCILYVPDLEEYLEKERELYFDVNTLPFPTAKSMDELCAVILNFDYETYWKVLEIFMKKIGSYEDGCASERVCEYIWKQIE